MKSTTSNFEDLCWLISLVGVVAYPVGFLVGLLSLGFASGYKCARDIVNKVWKEYRRIRK